MILLGGKNMDKKENSKGMIAIIIVLGLIIVGMGFYIAYDKGMIFASSEKEEKEPVKEEQTGTKKLDIQSSLVQSLYNKVNQGTSFYIKNKYQLNENVKMRLVGQNLKESQNISISCSEIPKSEVEYQYNDCEKALMDNQNLEFAYGYKKEYIESIYKELFGSLKGFDVKEKIEMDDIGCKSYQYLASKDAYIAYSPDGCGGAMGNDSWDFEKKLTKAEQSEKELKLYETEYYISRNEAEQSSYQNEVIYTFTLENGNYYFSNLEFKEKVK